MKKTYKAPKVKTVNIRMSGIIATSPGVNNENGKSGGPHYSNERNDFFDEEEAPAW